MAALALVGSALSGCRGDGDLPGIRKEEPSLALSFYLSHNGQQVALNESFIDAEGNNVKVVTFKFYMAEINLVSSEQAQPISEIELFDQKPYDAGILTPQWRTEYVFNAAEGVYDGIAFGIGVPGGLNAIDPATYNNEHPLSTYSNMYWSWASMYRFVILEAKVDTTGGENFTHDVIFHTGLDSLYRSGLSREINLEFTIGEKQHLALSVDWDDLFYTHDRIDIKKESVTHSTDHIEEFILAERFTDNFVQAIKVVP